MMTIAAVAWVLANLAATCASIVASRPEQLVDTLTVVDVTLDVDLRARLNEWMSQYRCDDAVRLNGTGAAPRFASAGRALVIASPFDMKVRYAAYWRIAVRERLMPNVFSSICCWPLRTWRKSSGASAVRKGPQAAEKAAPRARSAHPTLDTLFNVSRITPGCRRDSPSAYAKEMRGNQDAILLTLMFMCPAQQSAALANGGRADSASSPPKEPITLADLCDDIERYVRRQGINRAVTPELRQFMTRTAAMQNVLVQRGEPAWGRLQQMLDRLQQRIDLPDSNAGPAHAFGHQDGHARHDACTVFESFLDVFDDKWIPSLYKLKISDADVQKEGQARLKSACGRLSMGEKWQVSQMIEARKRQEKLGAWGTILQQALGPVTLQLPPVATPGFSLDVDAVFKRAREGAGVDVFRRAPSGHDR
ncbi:MULTISPECIES: hypothetical protein [Mycetohabitans]|uniref:hypothetical protein n=1 Tax=Mycetohabitans TaxID=2571159 RepID=UPI001F263848|nr:hypothetical protein [Mycetohabitans sp. B3]